jgi:hypothetical protein
MPQLRGNEPILGLNNRMTFFEQLFHAMGTNDLR